MAQGLGGLNRFRFADAAVDAALGLSAQERDPAARDGALRAAARLAFEQDVALPALHFPDNVWATRSGFASVPRMDEGTMATLPRQVP